MNTMDNAKLMEAIEKHTLFTYFEKLLNAGMHRLTLFPVFPLTAAANLSDPRPIVLVEDIRKLTELNSGRTDN